MSSAVVLRAGAALRVRWWAAPTAAPSLVRLCRWHAPVDLTVATTTTLVLRVIDGPCERLCRLGPGGVAKGYDELVAVE